MQDIAPIPLEQRRAAEERLRARYEAELAETVMLAPGERARWLVGPGRVQKIEASVGAHVEEVRLEGSFPSTCLVIVFRHPLRPGKRLAWRSGLWPTGRRDLAEPFYDDMLHVTFDEWIAASIHHAEALPDEPDEGETQAPVSS